MMHLLAVQRSIFRAGTPGPVAASAVPGLASRGGGPREAMGIAAGERDARDRLLTAKAMVWLRIWLPRDKRLDPAFANYDRPPMPQLRAWLFAVLCLQEAIEFHMVEPENTVSQRLPSSEGGTAELPAVALVIEGSPLPSLQDVERRYIKRVLQAAHGNQRQAARILGISRWSLSRRLRKYGLEPRNAA